MNDFTKEELYEIREEFIPDDDASDFYNNLCNKIQSLIDNYCEHVFIYITETPECIKCHAIPKEFNKEIE